MLTPPGTCAGPHAGGRATPQHPRRRPGDFAVARALAACLALALNEAEVNMSVCPVPGLGGSHELCLLLPSIGRP